MEQQQPNSSATKYVVAIIIIALIILGASLAGKNKSTPSGSETAEEESTAITQTSVAAEIDYTIENGFTPDNLTIKVGETVKFVNKSSAEMWVASAKHPDHVVYSGTTLEEHCPDTAGVAFDQCQAGAEYSFTFTKAGTWAYHNHMNAKMYGKVTVTE